MRNFDCTIVGASCVGGMTAKAFAAKGLDVALLEEHSQPGKFNKCTALVSRSGLEKSGVDFRPTVLKEIHGAVIHGPRVSFSVTTKKPVAFVLDRQAFDEKCVAEAQKQGVELFLDSRAESLSKHDGNWNLSAGGNDFHSKVVVGCDGLSSFVAREGGFPAFPHFVSAWEAEFSYAQAPADKVHVFLDQALAQGFFAWTVPVDETTARVGLATINPSALNAGKSRLLQKLGLSDSNKKGREFNYSIPLFPREQTQKDTLLLVGDAAGQVKSTTGGGIAFGGYCGLKAADAVENYFKGNALDYEERWRGAFAKTFQLHWLLHSHLFSLPNYALDMALGFAKLSGVPFLLENFGDMDFIFRNRA
ncbi:TPA: NAD(P)/FAD-dependent oxidoreductase [Candidatus Micrarchaeota archaeon]|nr:NAD(P)/FAD-dependent oxidoreductase [Candidatus Micrarchaeota archaeon]